MFLREWILVLNRNWIPISVTTVLRALCKLYEGGARVVDPNDYSVYDFRAWTRVRPNGRSVRTATLEISVPEVIVLVRYGGIPIRSIAFSRYSLLKRDQFTCQYCGRRPGKDQLTIDHVVPRSLGGTSGWDNCVVACMPCNTRKGSRTPRDAGLTLLSPPARPRWSPHMVLGEASSRESWGRFFQIHR